MKKLLILLTFLLNLVLLLSCELFKIPEYDVRLELLSPTNGQVLGSSTINLQFHVSGKDSYAIDSIDIRNEEGDVETYYMNGNYMEFNWWYTTEGTNRIYYQARTYGDDLPEESVYVIIDTQAPNAQITNITNAQNFYSEANIQVSGIIDADITLGKIYLTTDQGTGKVYGEIHPIGLAWGTNLNLDWGSQVISYYCEDQAGNKSPEKTLSINIIKSVPELDLLSPGIPAGGQLITNVAQTTLSGTVSIENGSITNIMAIVTSPQLLTITNIIPVSDSWSVIINIEHGENTVKLVAVSDQGAIGTYSVTLNTDLGGPDVKLNIHSGHLYAGSTYSYSGTATDLYDGVKEVWLSTNNGVDFFLAEGTQNWSKQIKYTTTGTKTILAYGVDNSDNIGSTNSRSYYITTVDNVISGSVEGYGHQATWTGRGWTDTSLSYPYYSSSCIRVSGYTGNLQATYTQSFIPGTLRFSWRTDTACTFELIHVESGVVQETFTTTGATAWNYFTLNNIPVGVNTFQWKIKGFSGIFYLDNVYF